MTRYPVVVRRWILVVVLAAGFAAIAYALLGTGEPRRSRLLPEQDEAPEPPTNAHDTPIPAPATTGTLVIRLRPPDGRELPEGAEAGYRRFGQKRLRKSAADGSFRFSDVPVGSVDVIAQVEGYESDSVSVVLVPGLPTEAVIVLRSAPTPIR